MKTDWVRRKIGSGITTNTSFELNLASVKAAPWPRPGQGAVETRSGRPACHSARMRSI